jgi:hypothetical protein
MHSEVYPELASVLQRFVAGVQKALGSKFLGAYLVGSLATGDFDLDSDVDFLILTNAELSDAEVRSLQTTHADIHALGCYPAEHLEGSYISTDLLNRTDLVGVEPLWFVDNGSTSLERSIHDNRWHVRWILRERGITIIGPIRKLSCTRYHLEPCAPRPRLRSKGSRVIFSLRLIGRSDGSTRDSVSHSPC